MKTRLATAFSRCRTFLRRWLRWAWLSRLPLDGPRPWQRTALRPRRPAGEPQSHLHPSLEVLEARWTPDDLFGAAASPVAVGGLVLLTGSRTTPLRLLFNSAPLPAAATPVLPSDTSAATGTPSRDPGAEEAFASGGVNDFAFLSALGQLPEPEYASAPAREVGADELSLFTSLSNQEDTADPLSGSASARQGQPASPLSKAPLAAPDSPAKYAGGGSGGGGSSTPNAGKGGGGPTSGGSLNLHLPGQNQLQQTNTGNNAAAAAGSTGSMPLVPVNGIAAPPPSPAGTTPSSATSSATTLSDSRVGTTQGTSIPTASAPASSGAARPAVTPSAPQTASTLTLTSSANPSRVTQSVTLIATVTGNKSTTPTGTVNFYDGSTSLGSGTLNSSGVATYSTSTLTKGTHTLLAVYSGNATYSGSVTSLTQTVNAAATTTSTTTSLSSSANPSENGQRVTLTAAVTGSVGTPTGAVAFYDGTTVLGTGTLNNNGVATFTTSPLSLGSYELAAIYTGDNIFAGSSSATLIQTVNQANTSTHLTATPNPSNYGQSVTFTATVSVVSPGSGTAAGLVEFEDGSTVFGTALLNSSGVATFTTAGLGVGVHDLTAVYEGNVDFVGSQASLTQNVNQAGTSISLYAFPNPSVYGQKVTFVASVADSGTPTAGPPTGQVIFANGSTTLGGAALSNGVATFSTSGLPVGNDAITAYYQSNSNPSSSGQQVTYTATVQVVSAAKGTIPPPPSGGLPYPTPANAIQLYDDISYANANSAVAFDIKLQASDTYNLSTVGVSGTQLTVASTAGVTINGNGATITAANNNRIFQVGSGDKLSLNTLTVTGGTVSAASAKGGGIADTGGNLTLSDVKVSKNTVAGGSLGLGQGGGIYMKGGSLTLKNGCTIVSNQATGGSVKTHTGQSITAAGGGIYVSGGVVNITSSTISNNAAKGKDANGTYKTSHSSSFGRGGGGAAGAGLYVNGTSWTVTVAESTVTSNSALGGKGASTGLLSHFKNGHGGNAAGGGIYASGGGSFHLLSTSLSKNKAQGGGNGGSSNTFGDVIDGGGIAAGGGMYFLGSASLTIQASGFETNTVTGGAGVISGDAFGGGLAIGPANRLSVTGGGLGGGSGGPVTIQQSSFDGNTALGGGPGFGGTTAGVNNTGGDPAGGGLYLNSGTVTITNSSVTNNVAQGGIGNTGGSAAGGGIVSGTGINNLTLINTTLGSNKAQGGNSSKVGGSGVGNAEGGGLYVYSSSTLINDTIAFNIALSGTLAQSPSFGGGIEDDALAPPVTLTNVILESNTIGTAGTAGSSSDFSGSVSTSSGYDFISHTLGITNASSLNSLPHMILGVTTSQLGTLTTIDSAPSLSYYPLLSNSTVRNTGTTSVVGTIAAAEGVTLSAATDEIGDPRTISNQIDMGAIEEAATATVIPSATSATLNPLTATQGATYSGTVLSSLSDPDSNVLYSETIDWGDGTTPSTQSIGSASPPPSLPTLSHVYSLGGDYEVTDTLVANRGGTSTTIVLTTTATVLPEMAVQADNLAASSCQTLTAVTVGTFQIPAVSPQSDYTATIDWGDGSGAQPATLSSIGSGSFNVVATYAYHLGGTFLTDVRVTDLSGTVVDAYGTVTVTPTTPAPDPALTVYDIHATQGVVSSDTVATFTTADTALASGAFAALIDWGDGTPQSAGTISGSAGSFTVSAAHTYTAVGLHEVQVAVTGPTGSGRGGADAEVGEATTISLTSQSLTLTANVSGSDVLLATATGLPAGAYSAKVDWGDSTAGTVGTAALVTGSAGTLWLAGSHSYANPGDYVARVRLYDANGNLLKTAYDPVTVTNLAEGTAGGDNFAWFQVLPPVLDQASLYSATINWGDSTSGTATMVSDGEYFSISQGQHNYAEEGTYTQQVTFSTSSGTSLASIQRTVVVADAPLTNASPPPSPLQGTLGTTFTAVPVASFNDADPNAVIGDFTATIDWGDGVTSAGTLSLTSGVFKVVGTHSYAAAADYTVSTRIKDQGGASLITTLAATVTPVVTLSDHTLSDDPSRALLLTLAEVTVDLNQGAVRISEPLDFDASPGTSIGGNPALVYNSATADGQAILQLYLNSSVTPQSATFTVTWEGSTLASIPWTPPSGQNPPTYVIDLPISPTVAASGVYSWTVEANVVYPGGSSTAGTLNGQTSVVVNTASPYGAGWGLSNTSRLVFTPTGNVLMIYGDGDSRLFTRNLNLDGSFTSPAEDFGTLSGGLCQGNYVYTDPHDVQYDYDLNGRLTQIVQPNSWTTSFSYTSGLLSKVTTPDSGVTNLYYNSNELLTTIGEPGGRTVSMTYGSLYYGGYNVTDIYDAANNFPRTFAYAPLIEGPHLLAYDAISYGYATPQIYYSTLGLLRELVQGIPYDTATYSITSASSALLVNLSDQPLAQMIDGVGNTTTYLLDNRGRELEETQPDGSSATWQLDVAGDATRYTDFNGLSTQYSYDSNGNLTQVLYPNGTSQNYNYDGKPFNEVTQSIDPVGNTTSYQYDGEGELTLQTIGYNSPQAATSSYTWSGGLMRSMIDPDGNKTSYTYTGFLLTNQTLYNASGVAVNSQSYTYDSAGNPATMVDSDKGTTQYFYDPDNELYKIIDPDGIATTQYFNFEGPPYLTIDGRGISTYYGFDFLEQPEFQITADNTTQAESASYDYNGAGQLTMSVDPAGLSTSYAYDSNGDQTLVVQALGTPQQSSTISEYDHDGNLTQSIDADHNTTSYLYDTVGNETLMIQGVGTGAASTTSMAYDGDGNLTKQTIGANTTAAEVTSYAYDSNGNQTLQITGYGSKPETTTSLYDGDGNLTKQVDGVGNTSTFLYDALGDQTQSVVGNATTKDSYDANGNLTLSVDAVGHSTSYLYDADGNDTLMIQGYGTASASTTSMAYDADGNETLVVQGKGTTAVESSFYAYDLNLNQTEVITGYNSGKPETTTMQYDKDNNQTQQVDGAGNTSTFAYDALGDQMQSVVGNATTSSVYDGDGNLTRSVDPANHTTSYQFDADGNETLMIQGFNSNAVSSTTYGYDAAGNETLLIVGLGTTAAASSFYAYDANGNQTEVITGYQSGKPETTTMQYDGDNNLTQQVDGNKNTSSFAYDALGDQTLAIVGNATTSSFYDGDGDLTRSVDAAGHTTSYQFDADGNETLMIQGFNSNAVSSTTYGYDAAGNETLLVVGLNTTAAASSFYAFDADGNQTEVITGYNSKPETTTMQYDGDNNLTQQVDGNKNTSTFAYDALGDQTQSIVGNATTSSFYDGDGDLTRSVDAANHTTSYQFDADGNETLMIQGFNSNAVSSTTYGYDAAGNETLLVVGLNTTAAASTSYAYDADGNQTQVITGYNSKPETTTMQYDGDNNLTQQVDGNKNTSSFAYDALGDQTLAIVGNASTSSFYDGDGDLTRSVDAASHTTSYQFDADGNETLMIQGFNSNAVSSTTYGYDAAGNETLLAVGLGTTAAASTSYAYDADGNQTEVITGDNSGKPETTTMQYDGDNNLTQQVDGDLHTSTFAYDALGDQTLAIVGNATTSSFYDGDGNLTRSVDAANHTTSYQYDADGQETLMIQGFNSNVASSTTYGYDAAGNETLLAVGLGTTAAASTSYAYDADGNQTEVITGDNSGKPETTTMQYDGDNNLTQQVDGAGHTSTFTYDALGDQTLAIVGLGSSNPNPGTTSSFYDRDGNLTLTVNAVGDSTSYQYDADGNQTLEIDGYNSGSSAATIHYLYDAAGNLTQEIDPVGNTTSFQYDADAEQTLMIQAYGTTSAVSYSYQYDNDGNLTLQTNPNGTSISSSYDLDGNLTQQLWYNNGGTLNNSLSYSYDGDGNILTAGNNAGTYHFAYNADGEQTQVITPSGVTLNYLYDASGNITQVSDSLGDTVASQYDANGNLLQRVASAFGAQAGVSFAYDGDGNITTAVRLALIGGVLQPLGSSTYSYDAQGDTTSIVYKNASGGTNDSFSYAYNAAGQATREVDFNGSTTTYAYDATGQLTSAGAAAYSYDGNGNPNKPGYTVGVNNEVTSDGTWSYGYDLDGNLTSKVGLAGGADAGLSWTYSYDPNNELTSAVEKNSVNATLVSATYSYDVFGQRIQSSVSNGGSPVVTNYVYNGSTLWATLTSADALQTLYVAGDRADQYFGQMNASSGGVYRTDRLGTVRDLVSTTGTVLDAISYDAFGNVVSQTTASLAPLIGYAGYQYDSSLGGDFTRSRIYLPSLGRFFTEDPTGLGPDSNLYRYVHNDPTNATDPTGQALLAVGEDTAKKVQSQFYNWKLPTVRIPIRRPDADLPGGKTGEIYLIATKNVGSILGGNFEAIRGSDFWHSMWHGVENVENWVIYDKEGNLVAQRYDPLKQLDWQTRVAIYVELAARRPDLISRERPAGDFLQKNGWLTLYPPDGWELGAAGELTVQKSKGKSEEEKNQLLTAFGASLGLVGLLQTGNLAEALPAPGRLGGGRIRPSAGRLQATGAALGYLRVSQRLADFERGQELLKLFIAQKRKAIGSGVDASKPAPQEEAKPTAQATPSSQGQAGGSGKATKLDEENKGRTNIALGAWDNGELVAFAKRHNAKVWQEWEREDFGINSDTNWAPTDLNSGGFKSAFRFAVERSNQIFVRMHGIEPSQLYVRSLQFPKLGSRTSWETWQLLTNPVFFARRGSMNFYFGPGPIDEPRLNYEQMRQKLIREYKPRAESEPIPPKGQPLGPNTRALRQLEDAFHGWDIP